MNASQSKVRWTGYYLFSFGEHQGSVDLVKGEIQVDPQQLLTGFFEVDMKSIRDIDMPADDGGKDLSDHLMSKDFFASDEFPVARIDILRTERIKEAKAGEPNVQVFGDLTIKGIKQGISFPAYTTFAGDIIQVNARFKFDRTKWGVHYNSGKIFDDVGDGAISDAIAIETDIVAKKKN